MIYVLRAGDRYIRSSTTMGDEVWSMTEWLDYINNK